MIATDYTDFYREIVKIQDARYKYKLLQVKPELCIMNLRFFTSIIANIMRIIRTFKNIASYIIMQVLLHSICLFNWHRHPDRINKIIIPAYTGLGNFVLKTPMIRALRDAFPDAHITIQAGSPYGTEFVLEGSDLINETKILKQESSYLEKIEFAFVLRREKYDLIFLPFDATPSFLMLQSLIANIPIRIGHHWKEIRGRDQWAKFLTHPVALKAGRHEIYLNLDLLIPLGITNVKNKDAFFSLHDAINVQHILPWNPISTRYWCVQLGAANAIVSVKRWDTTKFAAALDILIERYRMPVVALGDKYEREIYQQVQKLMKHDLIDCVGKTSIQEVAFIIKHSQVLLCHDSGLMHIAVALKTPVVAIYGPTDHTRTAPLGSQSQIIRKNLECSPCMYAFAKSEKEVADTCSHRNCMHSIEVDEVVGAVSRIFDIYMIEDKEKGDEIKNVY